MIKLDPDETATILSLRDFRRTIQTTRNGDCDVELSEEAGRYRRLFFAATKVIGLESGDEFRFTRLVFLSFLFNRKIDSVNHMLTAEVSALSAALDSDVNRAALQSILEKISARTKNVLEQSQRGQAEAPVADRTAGD